MFFEPFLEKLSTGSGFWHPLVWIAVIVVVFLLLYVLRGLGNKTYKKETDQEKPFLSGNIEYSSEQTHVKASNLYWGFMKSLHPVYNILQRMHTGDIRDYVVWLMIILAVFLVILGVI